MWLLITKYIEYMIHAGLREENRAEKTLRVKLHGDERIVMWSDCDK